MSKSNLFRPISEPLKRSFCVEYFMRGSRNFFFRGGGGVQVSLTKKALTFFFFFFFSPQLILQKSNGQIQRNLAFFKVPEGV